jgi:hypothetical protein
LAWSGAVCQRSRITSTGRSRSAQTRTAVTTGTSSRCLGPVDQLTHVEADVDLLGCDLAQVREAHRRARERLCHSIRTRLPLEQYQQRGRI